MEKVTCQIARRSRLVLAMVFALTALAAVFGPPVAGQLSSSADDLHDANAPSAAAVREIRRAADVDLSTQMVALVRTGGDVRRSRKSRRLVTRVQNALTRHPEVGAAPSWYDVGDPALISHDRRSTYIPIFLTARQDVPRAFSLELRDEIHREFPMVRIGGSELALNEISAQVERDLRRAEMLAFPLLLLLTLWVFRSVVAAMLPLFVSAIAILVSFVILRLTTQFTDISVFALNLISGAGLGLAIDYSLFIVSRYREELERHGPGETALVATMTTAGRTVLFSALTVAAALASLLVFPLRFLNSFAIGGTIVALVAAATALVALPALLAVLGDRVNALAPRSWQKRTSRTARREDRGAWYRLSSGVMRRPVPVALAAGAFLIALGVPFLSAQFTGIDASALPPHTDTRQVDDALRREFLPNHMSPLLLAVRTGSDAQVERYAKRIQRLPNVAAVSEPIPVAERLFVLNVTSVDAPLAGDTRRLLQRIRTLDTPFVVTAGGDTALFVDQQATIRRWLPVSLLLLASTTFVILFVLTGSVVLPVKALIMNFLTISAAFGLLVLIFQEGHLASWIGVERPGPLEATQPVLLLALAFGLSTDYGVFLLGRIKEAHDAGLPTREAVAVGLERSGRVVTAAALLFCVAMGAFATSELTFVKEVGVGTALAVLIDASIVRALLMPSLMAILGRWNWWAPRPLRAIHMRLGTSRARLGAGEGAPSPGDR